MDGWRGGDTGHVGAAATEHTHDILQTMPVLVYGPCGQRAASAIFDLGSQLTMVEDQLSLELGMDRSTQSHESKAREHR